MNKQQKIKKIYNDLKDCLMAIKDDHYFKEDDIDNDEDMLMKDCKIYLMANKILNDIENKNVDDTLYKLADKYMEYLKETYIDDDSEDDYRKVIDIYNFLCKLIENKGVELNVCFRN